ncbi:MAG: hypothetical protein WHV28_08930 [Bacteroidota bacterium]
MNKKTNVKSVVVCDKKTAKNLDRAYATKNKNANSAIPKRNTATIESLRSKRKR